MNKCEIKFSEEENYKIAFATMDDIEDIMKFIKTYWSADHILANCRSFFEYQYVNDREVCFVLAKDANLGTLEGVLGYIPYGENYNGLRDVYLALWKVVSGRNLFEGMGLLHYLEKNGRCNRVYCAGINPKTFSIYKYLGKQIVTMQHFYMLKEKDVYLVANVKKFIFKDFLKKAYIAKIINSSEELKMDVIYNEDYDGAYKTKKYINKRYFSHPSYHYDVYEVNVNDEYAYVVTREQFYNNETVLRIIEMWGNEHSLSGLGLFLHDLMDKKNYEYIDCYALGISEKCMNSIGFEMVKDNDVNIIPNYFEPFVSENVEIHTFIPKGEHSRMFKGDGDQDRPSVY